MSPEISRGVCRAWPELALDKTPVKRRGAASAAMLHSFSLARPLANSLTLVLGLYGAWGWLTDPQLPLVDRLGCAAIALLAQQMANMTAALAGVAAVRKQPVCTAGAIALTLIFSGVSGYSVEHTMDRPAAARNAAVLVARNQERERLSAEIREAARERSVAQGALLAIPTDIPTRRIQALQAPLNEVITRSDARIGALETTRSVLDAPIARGASARGAAIAILFWLLAFAEPGVYWLLSSLRDVAAVPAVPAAPPAPVSGCPGTLRSRDPGVSRRVLGRIAVAIGLTTAPAAHGADGVDATSHVVVGLGEAGTQAGGTSLVVADAATDHDRIGPNAELIAAILDLHRRGFSVRRIAAMLGQCEKSTVHRILQRERAAAILPIEPQREHP